LAACEGSPPSRTESRRNTRPANSARVAGVHIDDLARRVVTRVVDREIQITASGIEQLLDFDLAGRIGDDRDCLPPVSRDLLRKQIDGRLRSLGNDNSQAVSRKSLA
jgi:hypothetical protein